MGKFTEEDVKNLQSFLQFIADKGKFKVDLAEAVQLAKYRVFGAELLKKINDHIIELQKVTDPEQDNGPIKEEKK